MKESLSARLDSAAIGDTRHIKYVFVDIVRFSRDRSVEAQNDIVDTLNSACTQAFQDLLPGGEVIYVPTGDGICAAILDPKAKYDAHMSFALNVLSRIDAHNQSLATSRNSMNYMRRFELRIGISENVDTIVRDINGNRNVAGNGVTSAQRVMALAEGRQILLTDAAFKTLHAHEKYMNAFQRFKAVVKHDQPIDVFQFVQAGCTGLNVDIPWAFRNREPIEDQFEACLRENPSTAGQVRCTMEAAEMWEGEINRRLFDLVRNLREDQRPVLDKAQRAWARYQKAELEFSATFYSKMRGTMWRPIRAARHHDISRDRGRDLGMYLDSVAEQTQTE